MLWIGVKGTWEQMGLTVCGRVTRSVYIMGWEIRRLGVGRVWNILGVKSGVVRRRSANFYGTTTLLEGGERNIPISQ